MSKEVNVSRETAELAKAKGFNWETWSYYYKLEPIHNENVLENWNGIPNHTSAPTQSLLQKWLRDKYKILLWVEPIATDRWLFGINYPNGGFGDAKEYNTHEDALEAGLQEALKLITI